MLVAEFTAEGALLTCNTAMADFIDSKQSQPLQSLLPRNLYQQVLAGASVECELRPAHQPEQMLNATLSGLKDRQGKVNKILLYGYDASNRSAAISETLKAMQQVLSVTERIGAIVGSIHRTSARKPAISIAGGIAREELLLGQAHPVVKSSYLHSSRCAWLPIQWCAPGFSVAGIPGYRKAVGVQYL